MTSRRDFAFHSPIDHFEPALKVPAMSHKPLNSGLRFLTTFVISCMQVVLRFLIPAQSSIDFFVTEMGLFVMRTDPIRQQMVRATQKIHLLISSIAPTRLLVDGIRTTNVILVKVVERTHSTSVGMPVGDATFTLRSQGHVERDRVPRAVGCERRGRPSSDGLRNSSAFLGGTHASGGACNRQILRARQQD
jgi:hypothetical protein